MYLDYGFMLLPTYDLVMDMTYYELYWIWLMMDLLYAMCNAWYVYLYAVITCWVCGSFLAIFFQDRSRIFLQVFSDRSKHTKYGWVSSRAPRSLHDTFLFLHCRVWPEGLAKTRVQDFDSLFFIHMDNCKLNYFVTVSLLGYLLMLNLWYLRYFMKQRFFTSMPN